MDPVRNPLPELVDGAIVMGTGGDNHTRSEPVALRSAGSAV